MGKINNGILGGFSGKVGTVIGAKWKGTEYMRSRPGKRSGKSSLAQLEQQSKFGLMLKFIRLFGDLLTIGFKNFANGVSAPNAALAYNMKNAITGAYPLITVNYPKVLLSRGLLNNARGPVAKASADGKVEFTWGDNSDMNNNATTDHAILIIYDATTGQVVYKLKGASRSEGTDMLEVPDFIGGNVETWIIFISADGKNISNSVYTGSVVVV